MNSYVYSTWKEDIATKPSLKYLNSEVLRIGKPHLSMALC